METTIKINDKSYTSDVEPRLLLVDFIRDLAGLTGTKSGCDTGQCGACTILVDGYAIKSCTMLAVQADGSDVLTIEGVATNGQLTHIQNALWEKHGVQCGFCTPAVVLATMDLLKNNSAPTESEIRTCLDGIYCRCTGYHNIVTAIQSVV